MNIPTPNQGGGARAQILLVEDTPPTAGLIHDLLGERGFEVKVADTLAKAKELLKKGLPDLAIFDRVLPDGDGMELCAELRREPRTANLPLLMLTQRKAVQDRVAGLRSGADDYLPKPFNSEELIARVEVLLRRSGRLEQPAALNAGVVRLERESRRVFVKNKETSLTVKEFDLLWELMSQKNRVLTRDFLLQHVWGYESGLELTTKVVDVTVSHLRDKLGSVADMITAVRSFGYRLDDPTSVTPR